MSDKPNRSRNIFLTARVDGGGFPCSAALARAASSRWTLNGVDCVILAAKAGKLDVLRHLKARSFYYHTGPHTTASAR